VAVVSQAATAVRKSRELQRRNAKRMRHRPTDAEKKFWWQVRAGRLGGFKFKRQYPIGPYIADFVCLERLLIVELDGSGHSEQQDYDATRTGFLESKGFPVMRFCNYAVLTNAEGVGAGVWAALNEKIPPLPSPLPLRGRGELDSDSPRHGRSRGELNSDSPRPRRGRGRER
jgi:very-short-patch-repair endonuclease